MMACVLRELQETDVLTRFLTLQAYKDRCEARPAFSRAFRAHMEPFLQGAAK